MNIRIEHEQPIWLKKGNTKKAKRIFIPVSYERIIIFLAFVSILLLKPWNDYDQSFLFVLIKLFFVCSFVGLYIRLYLIRYTGLVKYCKKLDKSGRKTTTLFIVFNDNGFEIGQFELFTKFYSWESVVSYQFSKENLYVTAVRDTYIFDIKAFSDSQLNELKERLGKIDNFKYKMLSNHSLKPIRNPRIF